MVCNVIAVMEDFECWPEGARGKRFFYLCSKQCFTFLMSLGREKYLTVLCDLKWSQRSLQKPEWIEKLSYGCLLLKDQQHRVLWGSGSCICHTHRIALQAIQSNQQPSPPWVLQF